jgi:hypothetical protein
LARSLAQYAVSPPLARRRIDGYDGHQVPSHSRAHTRERVDREPVDVYTFMGRMRQHVFAQGVKRIRYYGVQATKPVTKIQGLIPEAFAQGKGGVRGAVKILARLTSRQRYHHSRGRDPLLCPSCHQELELWTVWHPQYGVV